MPPTIKKYLLSADVNIIVPIAGEFRLHPAVDDPASVKCLEVKVENTLSGTATAFKAKFYPGKVDEASMPSAAPGDATALIEGATTGVYEGYVPTCLIAINSMHTLIVWPNSGEPAARYLHITHPDYYVSLAVNLPSDPHIINSSGTVNVDITDNSNALQSIHVKVYPGFIDGGWVPWMPDSDAVNLGLNAGVFKGTVHAGEVLSTTPVNKTLAIWPVDANNSALTPQIRHFGARLP